MFHLYLLSIIEGLTEFLPISSTAHLIIFSKIFNLDLTLDYIKFYLLFIQLGALLAGTFIFAKKIFTDKKIFINLIISFIPSAILGFVFYKMFKKLLEGNILLMATMLILGGLVFLFIEKVFLKNGKNTEKQKDYLTKKDAFIVGLAQAIAIIPGVSRSGATIIAGIFRGIKKTVIIEYTFILALPTLGAAVVYDTYKSRHVFTSIDNYDQLFIGFIIAFVSGYIALFILRKYLNQLSLTFFAWYRIILALVILIFLI